MSTNYLIIISVILITVFVLIAVFNKNKLKLKLFKEFADKNGFEFHVVTSNGKSVPQVLGERESILFEITEIVVGTNTESKIYSVIRIYNSSFTFDFNIGKENFFSKIANKLGVEDVQIGHHKIDSNFRLATSNISAFKSFLEPNLLHQIAENTELINGSFENDKDQFQFAYKGELLTHQQWSVFEKMLDLSIEMNKSKM